MHDAQPLKYDSKISKIAQGYAEKLIASGEFEHSCNKYSGQQLGENLGIFSYHYKVDYLANIKFNII